MINLIHGVALACFAASALFFLKFWRRTGDRFFMLFSFSFFLLAVERALLVSGNPEDETMPYKYLVRLAAFIVILYSIVDKNRAGPRT